MTPSPPWSCAPRTLALRVLTQCSANLLRVLVRCTQNAAMDSEAR